MYPGHWSKLTPDKPAVIMGGSGETVTHRQLDERSNQLAQLMYAAGLRRGVGDHGGVGQHGVVLAGSHGVGRVALQLVLVDRDRGLAGIGAGLGPRLDVGHLDRRRHPWPAR